MVLEVKCTNEDAEEEHRYDGHEKRVYTKRASAPGLWQDKGLSAIAAFKPVRTSGESISSPSKGPDVLVRGSRHGECGGGETARGLESHAPEKIFGAEPPATGVVPEVVPAFSWRRGKLDLRHGLGGIKLDSDASSIASGPTTTTSAATTLAATTKNETSHTHTTPTETDIASKESKRKVKRAH